MKKILLLLAAVGMIFTACESANGLDEDNNGNPTEQPGNGGNQGGNDNTGGEDNPDNPGGGDQGEEPIFITDNESDIVVEAKGGTVVVTVSTNLEYSVVIPEEAQSWLSVADTRAIRMEKLTFTIAKNETEMERSAEVKLLNIENNELKSITFIQKEGKDNSLNHIECASNEIMYRTKYGYPITLYSESGFGAKLMSNTYENGVGRLIFDADITAIGNESFRDCTSIIEVKFPDKATSIGYGAFWACTSLISVTIPNSVTSIGNYAFRDCTSLISVTIPNSVTSIGRYAFAGCTGELTVNCNIPSASSYDYGAFYDSKFTKVIIGDNVTSIGNYAFYNCTSLISVTISGNCSVTKIGGNAFDECSSLTGTYVNITDLAAYAIISNNSHLFPGGKHLLVNGTEITELVIPNSVTSIGRYAFSDCTSLTSITIPDSVTSIGYRAFNNCTGELTINCNIPSAWPDYNGAFYGSKFTKVTIGNSVTSIGSYAFSDCTSLTSVDISDLSAWCKISFGGDYANPLRNGARLYLNGGELTDITIPSDITEIKAYAFSGYTSLTSITIPDSVTSIGRYAFSDCTSLTSITIPDSVTSIGYGAFWACTSLTSITIPDSITSIGGYAFAECTSLKEVYCKPTTPPTAVSDLSWNAFDSNASDRKIYVPRNSVDAYKAANYWNSYASSIVGYDF